MNVFVALFRGINVGGKNILPMKELVDFIEGAGCSAVNTYIQSGNAVFRYDGGDGKALGARIGSAIKAAKGFEPAVQILSADTFRAAAAANPFPEAEADPKSLHLSFLVQIPTAPDIDGLNALKTDTERFELIGDVFYLQAPDGIGRSKLAAHSERLLGVEATARNWRTVTKLIEMFD